MLEDTNSLDGAHLSLRCIRNGNEIIVFDFFYITIYKSLH